MQTSTETTPRWYEPISDLCILRYSVISSSFCTHHTISIFRNKQIKNNIYHFDRIWIAFIAFAEEADKKMTDRGSILADSRNEYFQLTIL